MDAHVLYIDRDFLTGDQTAACSCGWEGTDRDAWENHCDVVFMEATEAAGEDWP